MRIAVGNFWRWDGKVDRGAYALVGIVAFAIKAGVDRLVVSNFRPGVDPASVGFLFNYWAPLGVDATLTHLSTSNGKFLALMVVVAAPFMWLGVTMTVQRLRDAGKPIWLACLFLVPMLNLLLFAVLVALPSREIAADREGSPWPGPRALGRVMPRAQGTSAVMAIVFAAAIGLSCMLGWEAYRGSYGWSLFLALPFCLGLFSVLVFSFHQWRSLNDCVFVAVVPVVILGIGLVAIAVEGAICIVMAAPVGLGMAAFGGSLGYVIQKRHWETAGSPTMLSVVVLLVPVLFGVERAQHARPELYEVRSAVDIHAPPAVVWSHVVNFAEIPPPTEALFRAGIAYPIRAQISGTGPGAVRRCVFSTGPFVEPIEVWDEPRLLKFGVTENPAPLHELTPYGHIEPRHLHGYFVSEQGQFLLTELPGGRTRLEGTTWYRDAIWPAGYWRLWSDYIIHRIHMRVLEHIRREVETVR